MKATSVEPDCVVVIAMFEDGRVVLIREVRPRWRSSDTDRGCGCPAGHVEADETIEGAAAPRYRG